MWVPLSAFVYYPNSEFVCPGKHNRRSLPVSVAIPCYRCGQYLVRCVYSGLGQFGEVRSGIYGACLRHQFGSFARSAGAHHC